MKIKNWEIGNQSVVAVLVVVGVVTVGAIGWLFVDKGSSNVAWEQEKVLLEKSLELAQAEKAYFQREYEAAKKQAPYGAEEVAELKAQARLLTEEKLALTKKLGFLEEKLDNFEGNTFFSDLLRKNAELEVALESLGSADGEKDREIAVLKKQNSELIAKLNSGGASESILKRQLAEKEKVNNLLSKYLADAKNENKTLESQLYLVEQERNKLSSHLDKMLAEKELTQQKLAEVAINLERSSQEKDALKTKLNNVYNVVNQRLGEIVKVKQDLETTLDNNTAYIQEEVDEIELAPIVVKGRTEPTPAVFAASAPLPELNPETMVPATPAELVGQVLVVNDKLNFIVVNLGANQGVQVGMSVDVVNERGVVASTQVIEVRDNIAAADIRQLRGSSEIQEGDSVRLGS